MNYLNIIHQDIANGPGLRTTLFVSGCEHKCKGCQNPESWNISCGKLFTQETIDILCYDLAQDWCDGITISGGDPMHIKNREEILSLCKMIKKAFPTKNIVIYTGYNLKEIKKYVKYADYVIDGKFEIDKRDITLKWRGSSNQNIWKKGKIFWKKII